MLVQVLPSCQDAKNSFDLALAKQLARCVVRFCSVFGWSVFFARSCFGQRVLFDLSLSGFRCVYRLSAFFFCPIVLLALIIPVEPAMQSTPCKCHERGGIQTLTKPPSLAHVTQFPPAPQRLHDFIFDAYDSLHYIWSHAHSYHTNHTG